MNDAVLATSTNVCYLTTEGQEICDISCVRDGSHGGLSMTNLSWVQVCKYRLERLIYEHNPYFLWPHFQFPPTVWWDGFFTRLLTSSSRFLS